MSPQARKVLDELRHWGAAGASTRTIGNIVSASPDAVRRCLGELRREGQHIERIGGTRCVRLGA